MRSLAVIGLLGSLVTLTSLHTRAEVHRVPQDYGSVQAALDVIAIDDTVLVSLGTYAEELTTPPLRFWLIGDVEVDTGDFERPTIDPSTLDSARWRKCMNIVSGSKPTVERMSFANHAPMYPRPDVYAIGGVGVSSTDTVTFRQCRFDSVYRAIVDAPPYEIAIHLVVEDCRFLNAPRIQVLAARGSAEVRRCLFQGRRCTSQFLLGAGGSRIEECVFEGDSVYGGISLLGYAGNVTLRQCVFGSVDTCASTVFTVWSWTHADVEGNILQDVHTGGSASGWLHRVAGEPISFRNNTMTDVHSVGPSASTGLLIQSDESNPGPDAVLDSNHFSGFESGRHPNYYRGIALSLMEQVTGSSNHFEEMLPDTIAVVATMSGSTASVFRGNRFESDNNGMGSPDPSAVDARWNYWGDPTGPYNATYNPQGLGARVDDAVLFDPWCPDTNCFDSAPDPSGFVHPSSFILSCYPNPFNSTFHLTLIPAEVGVVKLELFDVLGRRASVIWHGPLAYQKDVTFDAFALASGIYFARVTDVISRKNLAMAKLVLLK